MAFPETPLGLRGELMLGGVWTDITGDIYTREPVNIAHGTSSNGAQPDPAVCSLLLNNAAGRYSPRNPLGPHFGLLNRNTPVRLTLPADWSYLRLDGGYSSTPHTTALAVPGDLDLRVDATLDDWVRTDRATVLMGKWDFPAARYSYRLIANAVGGLSLTWSADGTASGMRFADGLVPVPVPVDGRMCVRATLDVDNGSGGWSVAFYSARSMAGPWQQLGPAVTGTGVTAVASADVPLTVGWVPSTSAAYVPLTGRVHAVEVRSGIGGAVLAAPNFTDLADGATGTTDSAGRTWSLVGAAAISRRENLFIGEIPDWPPRWTGAGHDAWVPIEAAGILRRLGQGRRPLESTLRRRVPSAANLLAYWPMEDAEGATHLYSPVSGVRPLTVAGLALAADSSLPGSAPIPTLDAVASLSGTIPATSTQGWQTELVYHLPTMPAILTEIWRVNVSGSSMRTAHVFASTAGVRIETRNADGDQLAAFTYTNPAAITDFSGAWNRLAVYVADEGGGQTRVSAAWRDIINATWWRASTLVTGTMGTASGVVGNWGGATQGMSIGHLSAIAGPGIPGGDPASTIYNGADSGFTRETALDRMRRLAEEEPTLRLAGRAGDTLTPSEQMGPQGQDALMSLLGEVVETDGGILAETMDRLGLVYRDRATLYNQAPTLTLDYAAGQVCAPLEPSDDDTNPENDVTVTRDGGSSGRAVITEGRNSILPPEQGGAGTYEQAVTLSLGNDGQPRMIAGWLAHLGTWDEARYPTVRVLLHRHPELIPAALRLRVGDLVRIVNPPIYTGPGPLDLIVRQIQHEPRPRAWALTLSCTPAGPYRVGVVDDAALGRADTDGSVLSGPLTATDRILPVTVTAGREWVTAAPNQIADPGFEQGIGTWRCSRGTSIGVTSWERDIVHSGTGAVRLTRVHPTDTGTMNLLDDNGWTSAAAGQTWAGSAWVYSGGAAINSMRAAFIWRDAGGVTTNLSGAGTNLRAGDGWVRLTVSGIAPAGTASVRLLVEGRSAWTGAEWWVCDDVRLARLDTHLGADQGSEFPFDVALGGEVVTVHSIGTTAAPTVADDFIRATTPPTVSDAFGRTVADGWGAADTGQTWTRSGGTAADYAVTGAVGIVSAGVVNSSRFTLLPTVVLADVDMQADVTVPVVAAGASISTGLRLRAPDTSNYYYVEVVRAPTGLISVLLVSRVAGTSATIAAPVSKGTYTAGQTWTVRARLVGSVLQAKLWVTAGAEPTTWDVQAVTTSISAAGPVGTRTILSGGNTNSLPVVASWDNVRVTAIESGWGTSTSGHPWTRSGGSATEYTTHGRRGLIALTSVDSSRRIITGPALANTDIRAALTVPVVAATDSIDMAVMSRYKDSGMYYLAVLHCHKDATVDVRIRRVVAGAYTTLSISPLLTGLYAAGDTYWIRFQTTGSELRARGWKDGTAEPGTWHATATDTTITAAGQTGVRANLQVNNTNALPVVIAVDQFDVAGPQPFHVTRAVNGITKPHAGGTDVRLAVPTFAAL